MGFDLEEGAEARLDFNKLVKIGDDGLRVIPAIVQDADTGDVLTLAYVDERALRESQSRQLAVFWSTSRNALWIKGETSGDYLDLVEIRVNCEQNSLLFLVRPRGSGVCHTRNADGRHRSTCYYRRLTADVRLEKLHP